MSSSHAPDHLVALTDGRVLAVDEHGRPDGPTVVFLHSAPGSRRLDPDPVATNAAGIRLLTIDRAGYGGSSPLAGEVIPTVAGHADDVAAVLDHLGIVDAAVVGWSAGGRIALALAARRPELVRRIAVVGTPAPDDEVPWVAPEHREMAAALRADPASATATIASAFASSGPPGPDAVQLVSGGPADERVLEDAERRAAVEGMLAEAFRNGPTGVAADIVADQVAPWGFDPTAVGAPVTLLYGDADPVVSPDHGRWYQARLAEAELRIVPDAGHLVVLTEWPAILAAVG